MLMVVKSPREKYWTLHEPITSMSLDSRKGWCIKKLIFDILRMRKTRIEEVQRCFEEDSFAG